MTRMNRYDILYDGCFAHVFSRATEKSHIFHSAEDFEYFKSLLITAKQAYSFRLHHYCLMHTHFHLAVSMDDAKLFSEALRWVKCGYAKYYNRQYRRYGPLWRDRFKSLVIENEAYLRACGAYVENNPVDAGMAGQAIDWPYSSSRYYLLGEIDSLVDAYCFEGGLPAIEGEKELFFTSGNIIGTDLFKLHQAELRLAPVPL